MAVPAFKELLRCNGMDERAAPPGVIVPYNGENQVLLETAGMEVRLDRAGLTVHEFDGRELTGRMLEGVKDALAGADVDVQQRSAFLPSTAWQTPRFLRILGTRHTGYPGTTVRVLPNAPRARQTPVAQLRVAVVDQLVVKVAIRNVRARDAQGRMRMHARHPVHPQQEIARMNSIWRPQTNIVFELVPSSDVEVDDRDPKTQEELRVAYGMRTAPTFAPESTVWVDKNAGWFAKHRVEGAHMTFFVVHKLHSGGDPVYGKGGRTPNGTMTRATGVSFISDLRVPSTFAHEAGHWIGDMSHDGVDNALLMRDDGSGYRIPFALAGHFRKSLGERRAT